MKKLICIMFVLMMCVMSAGCVVRDPGPPSGAIFGKMGLQEYFDMVAALELPEEEFEDAVRKPAWVSTREEIEKIQALVERVPVPAIDGLRISDLVVWHDRKQVTYYLGEDDKLVIFELNLGDAKGEAGDVENIDLRIKRMRHYKKRDVCNALCEADGIDIRVIMKGKTKKEMRELLKQVRFVDLDEEREYREAETVGDPGPPTICKMGSLAEYFALEQAVQMNDEELERFLEEEGYADDLIYNRSHANSIIELVDRVPMPMMEGRILTGIEVYFDDNWMDVKYYFSGGMELDYSLDNVGDSILAAEDIRIEFKEERIYGRKDRSFFSVEIDGIPVEIRMPKTSEEEAKKLFEEVRFKRMSELRG